MSDLLALIGFLVLSFGASVFLAYYFTRPKFKFVPPDVGATLRIRAASGMYRSKLLSIEGSVWRISCPLSRNHYVPLRPEENVTIEAPVAHGVYLFKTQIHSRDEATHELLLSIPVGLKVTNRRMDARRVTKMDVRLEGEPAAFADLSPFGARVFTNRPCHVGERVQLDFNNLRTYAWVLDFSPTKVGESYREAVRVRFEESISI
ncbi:MAG: flagellar brake protein [Fimbriimonadaceae bacterium]